MEILVSYEQSVGSAPKDFIVRMRSRIVSSVLAENPLAARRRVFN
jgi:hypothetical protein